MIKVAVIYGGMSTEHDVSMVSAQNVIENLNAGKYDIYKIEIAKNGEWLNNGKKIKNVVEILQKMDVVFPVLHGLYGEDGTIQGMLEMLKVPYVGCKVLASSVCMDKVYTKYILKNAKINQAKFVYIKNENTYVDDDLEEMDLQNDEIIDVVNKKLGSPVFVKPSNSGSSVGVTKANNGEELVRAIQTASQYDKKILIEEAIVGKEVECAVLGNDEVKASTVGEIISAEDFYTYDAKYNNSESKTVIPALIPEKIIEEIRRCAIKAFKAVDGSGLARVDFFVEKDTNKVFLNEINTMPGFTEISMYPKLWEASGISYSELLDELIKLALQ
mgnify:FL=1